MSDLSEASKAAELIGYALDIKARPLSDSTYRALLDRYQTDDAFADKVEQLAGKLGLYVRRPTPLGLVLAGDPDGPFAVGLDNCGLSLRSGRDDRRTDRLCFALVLVALAAYAYPTGEDLLDPSTRPVRPEELERFITRHAATAAEAAAASDDDTDTHLGAAAAEWLDLPEVIPSGRGGYRSGCRRFYVTRVLALLADTGRARREPALDDSRGEVFFCNDRFRAGLTETAETLVSAIYAAPAATEEG